MARYVTKQSWLDIQFKPDLHDVYSWQIWIEPDPETVQHVKPRDVCI